MKKLFLVLTMVVMVSMSTLTAEAKTSKYYENLADNMLEELEEEVDGSIAEDEELYYEYIDGYVVARGSIIHNIVKFTVSFDMVDGNTVACVIVYDLYEDEELTDYVTLNDDRVDETDIEELYPELY